jgi:hypothetical protein
MLTQKQVGKCVVYTAIAVIFLVFALPSLMAIYIHKLAYMLTFSFEDRVLFFGLIFLLLIFLIRFGSRLMLIPMPELHNLKAILALIACFFMAGYIGADYSENIFGLCVKLFPGTTFSDRYRVIEAKEFGSKNRYLELKLQSLTAPLTYETTLSKKLWMVLPTIKINDTLKVYGERNLFGANILNYTVLNASDVSS